MPHINYQKLQMYRKCPLLQHRFKMVPELPSVSDEENVIILSAKRLFSKEAGIGYSPSLKGIEKNFSDYIGLLKQKKKVTVRQINNFTIKIKMLFAGYREGLYELGYRVVAIDLEPLIRHGGVIYSEHVPVIFVSPRDTMVPMYMNYQIDRNPARNNFARYTNALLNMVFDKPVDEYIILRHQDILSQTPVIGMPKFRIPEGQIESASKELLTLLEQIDNKIQAPNTDYCAECEYLRECRI